MAFGVRPIAPIVDDNQCDMNVGVRKTIPRPVAQKEPQPIAFVIRWNDRGYQGRRALGRDTVASSNWLRVASAERSSVLLSA